MPVMAVCLLWLLVALPTVTAQCDSTATGSSLCATCTTGTYGANCDTFAAPLPLELLSGESLAICAGCIIVVFMAWAIAIWGYITADDLAIVYEATQRAAKPLEQICSSAEEEGPTGEEANADEVAGAQPPPAEESAQQEEERVTEKATEEKAGRAKGNTDAAKGNTDAAKGNTDAAEGNTDAAEGNTDAAKAEEDEVDEEERQRRLCRSASIASNRPPPRDPSVGKIRRRPTSRPRTPRSRTTSVICHEATTSDSAYGKLVESVYEAPAKRDEQPEPADETEDVAAVEDERPADQYAASIETAPPPPDETQRDEQEEQRGEDETVAASEQDPAPAPAVAEKTGASSRVEHSPIRVAMDAAVWAEQCQRRSGRAFVRQDSSAPPLPVLQSHSAPGNDTHRSVSEVAETGRRSRSFQDPVSAPTARAHSRRQLDDRDRARERASMRVQQHPASMDNEASRTATFQPVQMASEPFGTRHDGPTPRGTRLTSREPSARTQSPALSAVDEAQHPYHSRSAPHQAHEAHQAHQVHKVHETREPHHHHQAHADPRRRGSSRRTARESPRPLSTTADDDAVMPPIFARGDTLCRLPRFPLYRVNVGGEMGVVNVGEHVVLDEVEVVVSHTGRMEFLYHVVDGGEAVPQQVLELHFGRVPAAGESWQVSRRA